MLPGNYQIVVSASGFAGAQAAVPIAVSSVRELTVTLVVCVAIDEASAKIRSGPPLDDDQDYELSVWAGVLPLQLTAGMPLGDPRLRPGIEPPVYTRNYRRTGRMQGS